MSSDQAIPGFQSVSDKHDLSPEEEERYGELFRKLDVDGDGRIDVDDLQVGLQRLGVHTVPGHAQVINGRIRPIVVH